MRKVLIKQQNIFLKTILLSMFLSANSGAIAIESTEAPEVTCIEKVVVSDGYISH